MEAEARLILSGRFLGYLPDHFAERFVRDGRLRSVRPDLFRYRANFQAAHNRWPSRTGPAPVFLNILAEAHGITMKKPGRGAN